MKIKIEIACDNAAFEGSNQARETARILKYLAFKILETRDIGAVDKLRDINGNTIGKVEVFE